MSGLRFSLFAAGLWAGLLVTGCSPTIDTLMLVPNIRTFNATNLSGSKSIRYKLDAKLVAQGEHCVVYEELGDLPAIETAKINELVFQFDRAIYPNITNAYGHPYKLSNEERITLLLLDVKDDSNGISGGYVAGYFYPNDLMHSSESNYLTMLYIDTNPGLSQLAKLYSTTAHEFQHLVNYSQRLFNAYESLETWIDEGFATVAEYLFHLEQQTDRTHYFSNGENSIRDGNTFYLWGNRNDLLAEYSSAYMFFQWLTSHAQSGYEVFKDIIQSPYNDYRSVTLAAQKSMRVFFEKETTDNEVWAKMLGTWFLANAVNAPFDYYGYKTKMGSIATFSPRGPSVSLAPAEGVYSSLMDNIPVNEGYLRYVFGSIQQQTAYHSLTNDEYQTKKDDGTIDVIVAYNANPNPKGPEITVSGIVPFGQSGRLPSNSAAAAPKKSGSLYPVCPLAHNFNVKWQKN